MCVSKRWIRHRPAASLTIHGVLLALVFWLIARLAPALDASDVRSHVEAWAVYAFAGFSLVAGMIWISALGVAQRASPRGNAVIYVVASFAVLYRCLLVTGPPILELDLYRYLWDGVVSTKGFNPYRYTPAEVVEAMRFGTASEAGLEALAKATETDFGAADVLSRVHYPDLPTVYPPVAQWLFAACATVSSGASTESRILVLKTALLGCEGATLAFVLLLLRRCALPTALIIIPAWCPLAVLSVANQGHLDSLPSMLATAAFAAAIVGATRTTAALAGGFLALGIGAKIYPLLLTPLLAVFILKTSRASRRVHLLTGFLTAFLIAVSLTWAPMLKAETRWQGLSTFASDWEMYDAIFALVRANLEPGSFSPLPWYSIVPVKCAWHLGSPPGPTRLLWIFSTGLLAIVLTLRITRRPEPSRVLNGSFLMLVFFWAAGPVCNPWYLMWAMPFLPFVGVRRWTPLFVLAPTFFLRFGLAAQFGERGEYWFDHGLILALTAGWIVPLVVSFKATPASTTSRPGP
jgi:hypothetical protein